VGGTKIAAALVNSETGALEGRRQVPTDPVGGAEAILARIKDLACAIREGSENALRREGSESEMDVGIGVAELVDLDGRISSGHTLPWNGWDLRDRLSSLGTVCVDSDIRTAARGEAIFGAGRGWRDWVYVSIGTGIGACLVRDGVPYAGARGNAMVVASAPLTGTCEVCGATSHPVTEELSSGPALASRFRELGGRANRAEDVFEAAASGNTAAHDLLVNAGATAGVTIGFMINTLDPEGVVIGGGLGLAEGPYRDALVSSTRRHVWADASRELEIRSAALGVDAGIVGAGLLPRQA
jgi:glucokinase